MMDMSKGMTMKGDPVSPERYATYPFPLPLYPSVDLWGKFTLLWRAVGKPLETCIFQVCIWFHVGPARPLY